MSAPSVVAASTAAGAHALIAALPLAYVTALQDGGPRLSGGKSQRVMLAREILNDSDQIVPDEPKNHLVEAAAGGSLDVLRQLKGILEMLIINQWRQPLPTNA